MFGLGMGELVIILIVGFMLFGPNKLAAFARNVGETVRKFKEETQKVGEDSKNDLTPP